MNIAATIGPVYKNNDKITVIVMQAATKIVVPITSFDCLFMAFVINFFINELNLNYHIYKILSKNRQAD